MNNIIYGGMENISGAWYQPGYITDRLAEFKEHLLELEWETKRTARHEYFMSNRKLDYTYGQVGGPTYSSKPFTPKCQYLACLLSEELNADFNAIFLNKYDDQHQHLGWHADDFPGMREDQPIAVLSFGAEREIWVKKQGESGTIPPEQRILLQDGSLFVMPVGYQDTHFHRIPKHDRPCGWRISLTFRSFK